jgi:CBS domain-containing protein
MKVKDVFKRGQVFTVKATDTWDQARQTMSWSKARHLPVMRGSTLVGVVTERDLLRHSTDNRRLVEEFMSTPARTTTPETELGEAEVLMASEKLACLPIVEGSEIVGIITATDLLDFHGHGFAARE